MHKRKQWIVAAGLALCGLLLAALTLGRPRDVPETSRDHAPRTKPGQRALAGGAGGPRLERFPGGKKRVLTRLGENAIYSKSCIKLVRCKKTATSIDKTAAGMVC